jgi:surface antigen
LWLAAGTAAALALGACNTGSLGSNQTLGLLGGGALGGLIGSQFGSGDGQLLATGLGVALGAFLGSEFGASLDARDRALTEQAAFNTYSTGSTREWTNPDTGRTGTVRSVSSATNDAGDRCQVQSATVTLDNGSKQESRYRLCRNDAGEYYTQPI